MRPRPRARGSFRTSYLPSRQGGEAVERSAKAIEAGGEEFEEVEITEDLELLADFVGDVGWPDTEKSQNPQPFKPKAAAPGEHLTTAIKGA